MTYKRDSPRHKHVVAMAVNMGLGSSGPQKRPVGINVVQDSRELIRLVCWAVDLLVVGQSVSRVLPIEFMPEAKMHPGRQCKTYYSDVPRTSSLA